MYFEQFLIDLLALFYRAYCSEIFRGSCKKKRVRQETCFEIRALPEVLPLRPSGGSVYYSMDTGSISVPGG